MKLISLIAQILLGLIFLFFGSNGFLHFLPMTMPSGVAGQFLTALYLAHYTIVVSALQVIGAVLLLVNRFVPLGLVLLGPIIVNIFLFHALMAPSGLPMAIVVIVLWILAALRYQQQFAGLFVQKA